MQTTADALSQYLSGAHAAGLSFLQTAQALSDAGFSAIKGDLLELTVWNIILIVVAISSFSLQERENA